MTADSPLEGWAYPTREAKKPHYFRDRRSLCGRYGLIITVGITVTPDTGTTRPSDCAACARKLEASR